MTDTPPQTRIQARNRAAILEAALEVFAARGFRGATLDRIAQAAGLSKPNLLYYFRSKEALHLAILQDLLELWLAPLRAMDPEGEPRAQIMGYVRKKLEMSRDHPRESRLFANEILQGAPRARPVLEGELKALVDEKAAVISGWSAAGRIGPVDPHHLIFSIWALTQHYADFEVQVRAIMGDTDPYPGAEAWLERVFGAILDIPHHGP
ncbi:TetR/AcrR family transcriptional regulator [Limimaricola variabilis]|uniref:TetR/AcrR family transcriptional regulator n=1 Tax=Limimaricola variabilis TaxID=1492771 RepID=A0ABR6HP49_9RHOB|nr:TetR family transcriptional regulator C-terminal domain-containing protein [Limimaricola variabilis]MBB3712320.1 TetR/AcrR family transcriptional regulator [Limimaricola variabilis]WPY94251.1 TetR family transcriptional regulator C-terminal domain-containing protein [Limimaricola variabilis]